MKRQADVSLRVPSRRAALVLGVLAATAFAGNDNTLQRPVGSPGGAECPDVQNGNSGGSVRDLPGSPADGWYGVSDEGLAVFWGMPTGHVVYGDTSGGEADEIARSWGFDVHDLYGGVCRGDPASGEFTWEGLFDALCLCAAINGMDPFANAEPEFWMLPPEDACLLPPEGSQSNGIILASTYGRAQFLRQSAMTSIRARSAHRISTGEGVVVAVLDTGADRRHPQLAGHVLRGHDFVDGDDGTNEGRRDHKDQDDDGSKDDGFGHGTAISGLVLGAAPGAKILPVRVLDQEGLGTSSRVAAGILWAVGHGANVINLSLGGGFSQAISDAVQAAQDEGVIVVAASGRDSDLGFIDYPASDERVIAVSSRQSLSGDVTAPAVKVTGPFPRDRWYRGTGTSFASALTSGGVALTLERHPLATKADVLRALNPKEPTSLQSLLAAPVPLDLLRLAQ